MNAFISARCGTLHDMPIKRTLLDMPLCYRRWHQRYLNAEKGCCSLRGHSFKQEVKSSLVVFYMDESKYFGTYQLLNKLVIKTLEFWLNLILQLLLLLYQLVISVLLDTTDKHVREHINKLELMTGKVIVIILYYKNYFIFVIRVIVIFSLQEQVLSGHPSEGKSSM